MARYLRRTTQSRGHSDLRPPIVIGGGIAFRGPGVLRVARKTRLEQVRHFGSARLRPPVVVAEEAAPFTARPVETHLASKVPQQSGLVRRQPRSRLFPPVVLGINYIFPGPGMLFAPRPKPQTLSFLRPPAVVEQPVVEVYFGPQVTLARIRPAPTAVALRPPTVVHGAVELSGPETSLAPSTRLGRAPHTRLIPPAVVGAGLAFAPPAISLTYSQRGKPKSRLSAPAVVQAAVVEAFYGPQITLAPQRRGAPHSRLAPPIVIGAGIVYAPIRGHLTYSRRGRPLSQLGAPQVVGAPFVAAPVQVALTRIRPQRTTTALGVFPPQAVVHASVTVTLVRILPPQRAVVLQPPVVVQAAEHVFFAPSTSLTYSRRGKPRSRLAAPAVIGAGIDFGPPFMQLAYSRRGEALSRLTPPAVVAAPTLFFGPEVTLTRIRPRPTTTTLGVFPPQAVVYAPISVHLAYSRRGQPISFLRGLPVGASNVYVGPVTHLAYSRRGKPFSQLFPVTPGKEPFRPVQVTLAVNKPKPTTTELQPPVVVAAQVVAFYGPSINLTYSRRGKPRSKLRPPAVIGAGIVFRPIRVNLVTDRKRVAVERGGPRATMWMLRPPQVLRLQEFDLSLRRIRKELTYSRRGRPISFLQPPVVVRLAVEIYGPEITLAPSRFPKPKSELKPPAVIAQPGFRPAIVWLTYSRRGVPKPQLLPVTPGIEPFRPVQVQLAPSSRGIPKSTLLPPAVIGQPPFRPIQLHLVRITPPPTRPVLAPPAVVGGGIVFRPVQIHLVRITPPPTLIVLRPAAVVITEQPGEVICEDDTPFGTQCEDDASTADVVGEVSASGGTLTGGDSATV
jgi:hypothetical protein